MSENKASFKDWLKQNMLRPAVVGDENFAFRLRSYIGSNESFSMFDSASLMEPTYDPNVLIIVGPLSASIREKIKAYGPNIERKVLYVESVTGKKEESAAASEASEVGATASVIKEFVEVRNVVEALERMANV